MKVILFSIICFLSTSVFAVDIVLENCKFPTPLIKVNASEWNMEIKGPKGDGMVCAAKMFCEQRGFDYKGPPQFEILATCSKSEDGSCSKTLKECAMDTSVVSGDTTKLEKKLNVRPLKYFSEGGR
jgi:hypothetical protein